MGDDGRPIEGNDGAANPATPSAEWETVVWDELLGHEVHVLKDNRVIRTGFVDAVTVGADGLWIGAEGVEARAFYEKARGHVVLPASCLPVPIVYYPVEVIPTLGLTMLRR